MKLQCKGDGTRLPLRQLLHLKTSLLSVHLSCCLLYNNYLTLSLSLSLSLRTFTSRSLRAISLITSLLLSFITLISFSSCTASSRPVFVNSSLVCSSFSIAVALSLRSLPSRFHESILLLCNFLYCIKSNSAHVSAYFDQSLNILKSCFRFTGGVSIDHG